MLRTGVYKGGERLPSVRQAAEEHGVSKNTMAEAYDRLVAEGLLEARVGSGYYVVYRDLAASNAPQPHIAEAADAVSLLASNWTNITRCGRATAGHLRHGWKRPNSASISKASRYPGRATSISVMAARAAMLLCGSACAFHCSIDRFQPNPTACCSRTAPITRWTSSSATWSNPATPSLSDDPGYYPLFGKLTLAKANIVGIRRCADGPDLEDLGVKLTTNRPKVFFTQSQAHNPTGSFLSPAIAFGLLQAAERGGFRLVEDDAFADILPSTLPRLAALDQLDRVLYVGTFSKTLSASLRSGFVAGHPSIISALSDIKMVTTIATSDFVERFIFNLIQGGQYLRHLRRLRARLEEANQEFPGGIAAIGLSVRASKVPGFYLWVELPDSLDELELCRAATAEGIFLAPGVAFRPHRLSAGRAAIRVNVAYGADPRFLAFLKRAVATSRG